MSDPNHNAVPPGGYTDPEERIERARLNDEALSLADQAVYEAILEARLRKHDIQNKTA